LVNSHLAQALDLSYKDKTRSNTLKSKRSQLHLTSVIAGKSNHWQAMELIQDMKTMKEASAIY